MKVKKTVAFQGEFGAYSELAAKKFFGPDIILFPQQTFESVFKAVEDDLCLYGIIPIENSLTGSLLENYDFLLKYELQITGEIKLRIKHNLIANPETSLDKIEKIYSHPQALFQCRKFIEKLKGVEVVAVYDTAAAVRMVKESGSKKIAAVAGIQAGTNWGLQIIKSGIESNKKNFTRFLTISKRNPQISSKAKTSIVFSIENAPGTLYKCLSVFATRGINLLKIESRPIHGNPWEYLFYLDFDGNIAQSKFSEALEDLKGKTKFLKFLGCYDKGKEVY